LRQLRVRLHRSSALGAGLGTLLAVLGAPAAFGAPEIGVNVSGPPAAAGGATAPPGAGAAARYMGRLKPGWVREWLLWSSTEPTPGAVRDDVLSRLGASAAALQAAGTKTVVVVVGAPQWASGSSDPLTPPANPDAMGRFMASVAGHPAMRGHIGAYEIWNEEDTPLWMRGAPDPAVYAGMLRAVYPAVKAADPSATVLVGGLTGNNYAYLDQLYASGAKGSFDGVAVHTDTACLTNGPTVSARDAPSGRISQFSFTGYREVYRSMVAAGDGDKGVWMTELGWNTSKKRCDVGLSAGRKDGGVSEDAQARFLTSAYACMAADPFVKMAAWFNLQDTGAADALNDRYGLLRADGTSKPSADALLDVARKGAGPNPACGGTIDAAAPQLALKVPGTTFADELSVRVQGSDDLAVRRIELLCDGRRIRFFNPRKRPARTVSGYIDWLGARKLPAGQHTLTARLFDEARHVTERSVVFTKVPSGTRGAVPTRTTLRVRRRKAIVSVSAGPFHASGRVTILVARKVDGRWRTFNSRHRNARRRTVVALPPSRHALRVTARYDGSAPFAPSVSRTTTVHAP
jgi:hypothetical protein